MAEEIIFKVGVNTGNTTGELDKVEKGLNDVDKAAQNIGTDASRRFDELNKKVASGTLTMRESAKAVKEYQTIALQAGRETPIGRAAIQAAGELTDRIGDLRNEIKNAGTDGASLQAALQLGSGVAAGYGAVQGTMALMGQNSESLEKALIKLTAVQSVLNGIEQIRATLEKESFLMQKARAVQTQIMTGLETVYAAAVGGTTGAMKALRLAMLALPIVALIAGVAALVTLFMNMESQGEKVTDAFKKQGQAAEEYRKNLAKANEQQNKSTEKILKQLDQEGARRKAMGEDALKVQKDINTQKIKELEIAIQQDAAAVRALNAQKEKLKLSQEQSKLEIANLIRTEAAAAAASGNEIQRAYHMREVVKLGEQLKEIDKESNSQIRDINEQLKARTSELESQRNAVIDLKTEQIELNRQQGEKAAEAKEKAKAKAQELAEEQKRIDQELINASTSFGDLAEQKRNEQFATEKALNEERIAENKRVLDQMGADMKAAAEAEIQLQQDIKDAKTQITYDALSLVSNLTELFGKKNERAAKIAFNIDKAAKIASAVMSGREATIAAFKTAADSPITTGFPAYPFIQAGLAAAFAATNIAKIASTRFEGGSTGGGGSVTPPSGSSGTPSVPTPEPATTTLTAGLEGSGKMAKVAVVDSDITLQQQKTQKAELLATWGG